MGGERRLEADHLMSYSRGLAYRRAEDLALHPVNGFRIATHA
jgi:hypothetical protein